MAGNLGFDVLVVADAVATFDRVCFDGCHYDSETVHQVSLASLHGEFATVVGSDEVWAMCGVTNRPRPKIANLPLKICQ